MSHMTTEKPRAYSYIRMSTPEQLKGHSKQRQLELSAQYALRHDLELVPDQQIEDLGVSAFKGDNVRDGALGSFLKAVETGTIPKGSYLLVEALDRISRQELLTAQTLFLRIISAGIRIVTLQDDRVYSAESTTQLPDLILSLTFMSLAHEESEKKSKRVAAAWSDKRARAKNKCQPLTKWCPAWLRLSTDRSHYETDRQRVAVVQSIFQEALAGIGILKIAKRLNERRIPVWGKSHGWHPSYIAKILGNKAVIGEYQPCRLVGGKRQPVGDPIENYFPRVIEDDVFYRAQQARSSRRVGGAGRKGKYLTNLFSGLAVCAYCRSRMMFDNKGSGPKGSTFLVCEAAKRGHGCGVTTGWRYDQFEASFLAFVRRLDLSELLGHDHSKAKQIDESLQALEGRRITIQQELDTVYNANKFNPNIQYLAKKLEVLENALNEIEHQIKATMVERRDVESTQTAISEVESRMKVLIDQFGAAEYKKEDKIKSLVSRFRRTTEQTDLYKLRSEVVTKIKSIVRELQVAPVGGEPLTRSLLARNPEINIEANIRALDVDREKRWFQVKFYGGTVMRAYPNRDDPLEYDSIVEIAADGRNPSRQYLDMEEL